MNSARLYQRPTLVSLALCLTAGAALAQPVDVPEGTGLLKLVPDSAFFWVERRGHDAIKDVFDKTNTGKLFHDEVMQEWLTASRKAIGRALVAELVQDETEAGGNQSAEQFHDVMKPIWYDPCVLFGVPSIDRGEEPGLGVIVMPSRERRQAALDGMKALMERAQQKGEFIHPLEFTVNGMTWTGVSGQKELPADDAERRKRLASQDSDMLVMHWRHPFLVVAFKYSAAEVLSKSMAPGPAGGATKTAKVTMSKTAVTDWALRAHLDIDKLLVAMGDADDDFRQQPTVRMMGLGQFQGVGSTIGYIDGVLAQRTYIHATGGEGLMGLFKPKGDYRKALSMIPTNASISLAGQVHKENVVKFLLTVMDEEAASQPAADSPLSKAIRDLAAAMGPDVGIYLTELQMVMGGMGGGGMPVGAVASIPDKDKAFAAFEKLLEATGMPANALSGAADGAADADGDGDGDGESMVKKATYRKVEYYQVHQMMQIAFLDDRLIFAMNESVLKSTIDAAKDKEGGFAEGSKAAKLLAKTPKGPALYYFDTTGMAKLLWPMLIQAQQANAAEMPMRLFPGMPSPNKIVRLVEPELTVIQPDETGLLFDGRGQIPFMPLAVPAMGSGMFFWMMF